jgi:hypothetical protein
VRSGWDSPHAPRSRGRAGARGLLTACVASLLLLSPVSAQEPPDSLAVPDSVAAADSVEATPDSISADTIYYNLPELSSGPPSGFATGIWRWDRADIMASGANTLAELFAEVPGLIALWGGDYGTPLSMSAFGVGGGGYRIYRDGFALYPLEGGVPDLQHVGLAGISRVILDRSMGALVVRLWSHRYDDGRPFSVIEAGTGDFDTNAFRGVFAEPTALGGSLAVGIERVDTRGRDQNEGGNRTGGWARYQLHLRNRAGLAIDFRRMGSQTQVPGYAPSLTRTDVALRGRIRVVEGVVAEAYTGRSRLDASDAGEDYSLWGGSRAQHGLRLELARAGAWVNGAFRLFEGHLPSREADLDAGYAVERFGITGAWHRGGYDERSVSSIGGRAWLGPVLSLTAFASWESGTYGSRDAPVLDGLTIPTPPFVGQPAEVPPSLVVTDRTGLRAGGSLSLFGAQAAGAFLWSDNDAHLPLSTELDLGAPVVTGGERTGFEAWGSIPLPVLEGLRLDGSYQWWEAGGPYLPPQIYRASFEYHRVHLESGNLELWGSLGVRGHDPMTVSVADDGTGQGGQDTVPFYQDWYARIQVRIVTVRLFLGWDNFTFRRNLQTFPDRRLPYARSFFGLRWDMWN